MFVLNDRFFGQQKKLSDFIATKLVADRKRLDGGLTVGDIIALRRLSLAAELREGGRDAIATTAQLKAVRCRLILMSGEVEGALSRS